MSQNRAAVQCDAGTPRALGYESIVPNGSIRPIAPAEWIAIVNREQERASPCRPLARLVSQCRGHRGSRFDLFVGSAYRGLISIAFL
jgi:hypothetical protein